MNAKRTQHEIEKDCNELKKAAKTAKSMRELETMTGLSASQIKTTLSKHPIIFKRIKEDLAINKEKALHEEKKRKELEAKLKKETRLKEKEESKKKPQAEEVVLENKNIRGYVIDASITGISHLRESFEKIYATAKEKIILTSITIKELKRMQNFNDVDAKDAAYILSEAVEKKDKFETVLIDETLDTEDDCIVKYCADNKESVILLTSDKEMALNARMYGVKTEYLKQNKERNNSQNDNKIKTLYPAKKIAGNLLITNLQTDNRSICVYSQGKQYNDGICVLKIGDDVFISTKKENYITFAHYRVISLYAEENCELIYSKRLYDYNDVDLPKEEYITFVKDFIISQKL